MGYWALVLSADEYAVERLYANASVGMDDRLARGDRVLVVADGQVIGLGQVDESGSARYTHRLFDEPLAAGQPVPDLPGLHPLSPEGFAGIAGAIGAAHRVDADKRTWLVSLDLPIEAGSPAEAVREFWTYVSQLGPAQLPTYVWPTGDELAMQAYLLGEVANQDPEED